MAHTVPILVAFILNVCGIFIFRSLGKVTFAPVSTYLASYIFTIGTFFLLLNVKIYPPNYRKSHWIIRSLIEFLLAAYTFETCLCDFWFPLENFMFTLLGKTAFIIKKFAPRTGVPLIICCKLFELVTYRKTPVLLSFGLATFFLLFILHGTRTVDFRILYNCGMADFANHMYGKLGKGVKSFKKCLPFLGGKKSGSTRCRPC